MLLARPLAAHVAGQSYAEIEPAPGGLRVELSASLAELNLQLDLDTDLDGGVAPAEIEAAAGRLGAYFLERFVVEDARGRLAGRVVGLRGAPDASGHPMLHARLDYPPPAAGFWLRSEVLRDLDPAHKTFAAVRAGGARRTTVLEGGRSYDAVPPSLPRRMAEFVGLGIEHIFTGYDHLVFLLGLLIAGESLGAMLRIVTSFTVAHSLTLALAGLGMVRLPGGLVEAAIAASIVYVGVENLVARRFTRRFLVTFGLGLVHGFGFASVLGEVAAQGAELGGLLFAFNLGVELGQVAIVALALPLILGLRRRAAYPLVLRVVSVVVAGFGLLWLAQRTGLA